jgi:hypothetical protein
MSAPSASETPSPANPFLHDLVASLRTVVVPGSPATYANRAALREMGLRWDPAGHRWHGTTTAGRVRELRERLGLEVRCFGVLEPPRGPSPPAPPRPIILARRTSPPVGGRDPARQFPSPRFGDYSRTRFRSRVAFGGPDEDAHEISTPTRQFSLLEITSGLPDDSREADERAAERRLRELRAQVKMARAAVATTPGLVERLARDWRSAARFYARQGISESQFIHGVPSTPGMADEEFRDRAHSSESAKPIGPPIQHDLSLRPRMT